MLSRDTRGVFTAILLLVAAIFLMPVDGFGQTFRGGINGTVTDQSGAVVPGATVEATESSTGVSRKTVEKQISAALQRLVASLAEDSS